MKKGFTLIEMMIVLTIIALIFLLMVPNISKVLIIINNQSCSNQLKIIDTAILEYQLEYDITPSSIEELINDGLITENQRKCRNGQNIVIIEGKAEYE